MTEGEEERTDETLKYPRLDILIVSYHLCKEVVNKRVEQETTRVLSG